jgi:glycosyltransferase involved in cell wall biosynthesis
MFAVLSHILPPSPSGQAAVLQRILRDLNPKDYCLISRENYDVKPDLPDNGARLPARYFHLQTKKSIPVPNVPVVRIFARTINFFLRLWQRTTAISRILKQENCSALVACTGDLYDLPAGYLASRQMGIPFYLDAFDDYIRQWTAPDHRFFAEIAGPLIIRGAGGVIAPNEFLRDDYRKRYAINPIVIHNPCDVIDPDLLCPWPAEQGEIKIVYTGAVYHAHYDAFRNLLAAMELSDNPRLKLHLYSSQTISDLEKEGIKGPVVVHPHLPQSKIAEIQRCADILFLPLAFRSSIPEIIRTSAPGKMGEYLASGRPVLVHAPSDSFICWYFKTHHAGQVAEQPAPATLAGALQQMIDDPDLRRQWCENAVRCAWEDFSLPVVRNQFLELVQDSKRN